VIGFSKFLTELSGRVIDGIVSGDPY